MEHTPERIEDADAFVEELKVMCALDAARVVARLFSSAHSNDSSANYAKLKNHEGFMTWSRAHVPEIITAAREIGRW
jgi:hypothetical protein